MTETVTVTPTLSPEMEVEKLSDGDDEMTIVVSNVGAGDAQNVVLEENLRPNVEYRIATTDGQQICVEVGGLVTCRLGDVNAGESVAVDFSLDTNGIDPASGQTTVRVNGQALVSIDEPYISKFGDPPVAPPGSALTYTIRVINPTGDDAQDMVITDLMPEAIDIIDGSATAGDLAIDGQDIVLTLDTLDAGGVVFITLDTVVRDDDIFEAIENRACVESSLNAGERCAITSFLAVEGIPDTGEVFWLTHWLRWSTVLIIASLMLVGLGYLARRMRTL